VQCRALARTSLRYLASFEAVASRIVSLFGPFEAVLFDEFKLVADAYARVIEGLCGLPVDGLPNDGIPR